MALYVKTALLQLNSFTIGSQLNSLNISADRVLKSTCNIIRAARFWSVDILSRFDFFYTYFIATNYSNGVGSQVLATLVTTLPLHIQINQSM